MDADHKNKPDPDPGFPREGFDDAQRLADLRRQAQQRMREEEQAANNVPTDPHGIPVAPVYGGPPFRPSPSDDSRVNQTVYGAPPLRMDTERPGPPPIAAVYGGPPEAYREGNRTPYPAPAYGGAPRPVASSRILLIAIGIGIVILVAAWILKHAL